MKQRLGWYQKVVALLRCAACAGVALVAGASFGAPVNPDPATWSNDTGAITLGHGPSSFSVQQFSIVGPDLPIYFGFYFNGTAGLGNGPDGRPNAGMMFDPTDPPGNQALIDFANGVVTDVEDAPAQSLFTTQPPAPGDIGFFISVLFPGQQNFFTFYTDPALNGGFDLAGTFPALADASVYLVSFQLPAGWNDFIDAYRVMITGLRPVPEPGTMVLVGLALVAIAGGAIRRTRG